MSLPLTLQALHGAAPGLVEHAFLGGATARHQGLPGELPGLGSPKPYPLRETCSHAACSQVERLPRGREVVGHLHTASPHRYFALNCVTYMVMFFLPTQLTQIFPDFAAWQVGLRNAVPTAFKP